MHAARLPSLIAATLALLLSPALCRSGQAGSIGVRVLDRDGAPVPEVVVHARALPGPAVPAVPAGPAGPAGPLEPPVSLELPEPPAIATMNQHDLAFAPHILVVEAGTRVEFPNADAVLHHVYSFSPAKQFDVTVDAGVTLEGLQFSEPGVVTLGCNIHDGMLGYIVVTDTPHYGKTDADGRAVLQGLAAGRYEITIWTPRLAARHLPPPVVRELRGDGAIDYEHQLTQKLYPAHAHSDTSLRWSRY